MVYLCDKKRVFGESRSRLLYTGLTRASAKLNVVRLLRTRPLVRTPRKISRAA